MQMNRKWISTALAMAAVLVLSTSAWCGLFGKNKFEAEVDTETVAIKLVRDTARGGYDLVSTIDLKKWIDEDKDIVIVDTMPYDASYAKGHVPGARQFLFPIPNMSQWNTDETAGKTAEEFKALLGPDTGKTIVIYCGFVKCTRSHNGAAWARKLGYTNVYRYPGGIFAWKGAGYALEKVK